MNRMPIRDAWDNYVAETDLLYSTPRILRPFHFGYLYLMTDCYHATPEPEAPPPCDHKYHRVGHVGMCIFYECALCGDEYEKDVS